MASISTDANANETKETKQADNHACICCGHQPLNSEVPVGCIHLGKWHSAISDCSLRCAWKLGRSNLGTQHYSCCYSTDKNNPSCSKNATHSFASAPVPKTSTPSSSSSSSSSSIFGTRDCPKYIVDLDSPADKRWNQIVNDYADHLPNVVSMTEDILGSGCGASLATTVFATAAKTGFVYYADELRGIAKASGVPLGKVVLLQIAYEAFAACTSIVVDGPNGYPLHIRTMDWDMPELQPLTIQVEFVSKGRVVYQATTWAGYVGVLTGIRNDGYSVSVNYRRTKEGSDNMLGGIIENLKRGAAGGWPVSFLVRECMETCSTFDEVVASLQQSELMAPVYLTVAGIKKGEGIAMARDRKSGQSINVVLNDQNDVVVQANMDIWRSDSNDQNEENDWQDICESRYRRSFAKAALSTNNSSWTMFDLWCLFSLPPCLAHDTVYTASMIPATSELVTRVNVTRSQKHAGNTRWGHIVVNSNHNGGATRQ
jgi:hypothetical protein